MGPKELPNNPDMDRLAKYGTASVVNPQNLYGTLPTFNYNEGQFAGAELDQRREDGRDDPEEARDLLRLRGALQAGGRDQEGAYRADPVYGGPEYESIGTLGSYCGISDLAAIAHANQICNENGVDTIACGAHDRLCHGVLREGHHR